MSDALTDRPGSSKTDILYRNTVLLDLVLEDMRRVLRYVKEHEQDFICKARCCRSYDRDHAYRSSSAEYDSEDGSFKTNLYKRNLGGRYV